MWDEESRKATFGVWDEESRKATFGVWDEESGKRRLECGMRSHGKRCLECGMRSHGWLGRIAGSISLPVTSTDVEYVCDYLPLKLSQSGLGEKSSSPWT